MINLPVRGKLSTQGFILQNCPNFGQQVIIKAIHPGTEPRNSEKLDTLYQKLSSTSD